MALSHVPHEGFEEVAEKALEEVWRGGKSDLRWPMRDSMATRRELR
jgi:hypothetical protein